MQTVADKSVSFDQAVRRKNKHIVLNAIFEKLLKIFAELESAKFGHFDFSTGNFRIGHSGRSIATLRLELKICDFEHTSIQQYRHRPYLYNSTIEGASQFVILSSLNLVYFTCLFTCWKIKSWVNVFASGERNHLRNSFSVRMCFN